MKRNAPLLTLLCLAWIAVVLAAYYGFNADYYGGKIRLFGGYFLR